MKAKTLDPIHALSSRVCAGGRMTRTPPEAVSQSCSGTVRPFCMLCSHCPTCIDNPHSGSCELGAGCRACEMFCANRRQ